MKQKFSDVLFHAVNHIVLTLFAFICVYPFYYILTYSLSNPLAASKGEALLFPSGFTVETYKKILSQVEIYTATGISLSRTVLGTAITVLSCSFFAFLLTRDTLPIRKFVYRMMVVTMYFNAGLIPYYLTMSALGLKNSFLIYIIPGAISAYNVILMRAYIQQMPAELAESAMIDGANVIRIFTSVYFPLLKPITAAIAIFAAVGQWNAWFDNMLFISNRQLDTLQYILYQYLAGAKATAMAAREAASMSEFGESATNAITPMAIQMTTTVIVVVPVFLIYPFFQKYFTKGIMLGAVKG